MKKSNKIIIILILSVSISILFFSCDKGPDIPPQNNITTTDSCDVCDKMKAIILNDNDIDDRWVDSLSCKSFNSEPYCSVNNSKEELYGTPYELTSIDYLINGPNAEYYTNIYADFKPNSDTPFMGPIRFSLDFQENCETKKSIRGFFMEDLYYYDPNFTWSDNNGPRKGTFLNCNKYPFPNQRLQQHRDTISYFMGSKMVFINGEKKYYWTLYTMVMAPDRESMSFKGEFYVDIYDRQRGISPITSTQYNLKRIK